MSLPANIEALAIIPVRVGSQRLPGKALLRESGQELFLHTCDQARKAANIDVVCVATDDDDVEAAASRAGYEVVRTSEACRTGSERCAEAAKQISCSAVLDIQGDWPEVDPSDLESLVAQLLNVLAQLLVLHLGRHRPPRAAAQTAQHRRRQVAAASMSRSFSIASASASSVLAPPRR